eukprot:4574874-Alexandrium_andersonii.AAC.1
MCIRDSTCAFLPVLACAWGSCALSCESVPGAPAVSASASVVFSGHSWAPPAGLALVARVPAIQAMS